jgi:hypothetical protein
MAGSLLLHVNVVPGTGCAAASNAAAPKIWDPPTNTLAEAGVTVTVATTAGGRSWSLHAPKVLAAGPLQTPAPFRESDRPNASVPTSVAPISVDTIPLAAPPTAVKLPS